MQGRNRSAESAILFGRCFLNRAFSANDDIYSAPGTLPQAKIEVAQLALTEAAIAAVILCGK